MCVWVVVRDSELGADSGAKRKQSKWAEVILTCFLKGLVSQFVVKGESDYALLIKIDLDGLQVYCSTCFGQFGSVVEFITFLVFFADGNLAGDWLHRNKSSFA